jgi:hypothetical protein
MYDFAQIIFISKVLQMLEAANGSCNEYLKRTAVHL